VQPTEKQFRQGVYDLARTFGWLVYFTWNSLHSPAGFPDLVLVKDDQLIFAELKSQKGKTTPAQDGWIEALRQVPDVLVFVWRPSDWDEIVSVLDDRGSETW
jgi:hypothetical protein